MPIVSANHRPNRLIHLSLLSLPLVAALVACGGSSGGGTLPVNGGGSASSSSSAESGPGVTEIDEPGGLPAGYNLVWSDEFSTNGAPDSAKWAYDTAFNTPGWFNDEKQYYSANRLENARIESDVLIIEARKESLNTLPDWAGQAYSSARLTSKKTYTYGFVEVRAWVPCAKGSWPAIWQLPTAPHTAWPDDGEIDIMEYVGWDAGRVYQTVHTKAYNHSVGTQKGIIRSVPDACNAWHRYQLLWTAQRIMMGIDDRYYFSFKNDGSGNYNAWPFSNPQYILLNLAVGGTFGGVQGIDDASMPWQFKVDYVRLYQKP